MDRFFSDVQKQQKKKPPTGRAEPEPEGEPVKRALPKGVVLGKDGKPCRSCTSTAAWLAMARQQPASPSPPAPTLSQSQSTTQTPSPPASDCPPDVDALGRSTWTFLHTLSASYPPRATLIEQSEMRQFLALFSKLYPCWHCAEDFQRWQREEGNAPRVGGRGEFGGWLCRAHNAVNRKLGKGEFDCARWEERWRTGWREGGCD
ncbi:hypothetical protein MMC21_001703 [Puttea exsequens]|nr:hypothetical protein [Puttea exsequens]